MNIEYIFQTVKNLESFSIYALIENKEIQIIYEPMMIPEERDSMIICHNGIIGIFVRPLTDRAYIEFLLWHEFAHYMLHYHPALKMNYTLSAWKEETEQEANLFAVFGLLIRENLEGRRLVEAAIEHGVPPRIASDVFRILSENRYMIR